MRICRLISPVWISKNDVRQNLYRHKLDVGELSREEIADVTGLPIEKVREIAELQPV